MASLPGSPPLRVTTGRQVETENGAAVLVKSHPASVAMPTVRRTERPANAAAPHISPHGHSYRHEGAGLENPKDKSLLRTNTAKASIRPWPCGWSACCAEVGGSWHQFRWWVESSELSGALVARGKTPMGSGLGKGTSSTRAANAAESTAASSRWGNAALRAHFFRSLLGTENGESPLFASRQGWRCQISNYLDLKRKKCRGAERHASAQKLGRDGLL